MENNTTAAETERAMTAESSGDWFANDAASVPETDGLADESEDSDICYGCENEEEYCTCDTCILCGDKEISWIRNVHVCQAYREPEICQKCLGADSEKCQLCLFCHEHCFCPKVDRKVLVSKTAWVQQLDTSPRVTEWGESYPHDMYVKVNCEKTWVLAVKKPSAIIPDVVQSIKGSVQKARTTIESQYDRFTQTDSIKRIRFAFEKKDEGTHLNIKSTRDVKKMVKSLSQLPHDGRTRAISFDCEGVDLGRHGTTCYLQIQDNLTRQVYLIDLLTLGQKAWTTGCDGHTLKSLFEDPELIKLIYDVRSDSDALCAHYGIKLAGVLDVQYLYLLRNEEFTRRRPRYADAMIRSRCLDSQQQRQWDKDKAYPFNNDYSVFMERPLSPALKAYSINDVIFLDILAERLIQDLSQSHIDVAMEWTEREIRWTQTDNYYEDYYSTLENRAARAFVDDSFADHWYRLHSKDRPLLLD